MTLMLALVKAIVLVTVLVLACIQIPLDLRQKVLSRLATLVATMLIAIAVCVSAVVGSETTQMLRGVGVTVLVTSSYALWHRASPDSLGLGDVLLVVPLTLAVAYATAEFVVWWQLSAAIAGSVHATWARVRLSRARIPFGPHLLLTASAILTADFVFSL